jgi:hypothetical protein
MLNAAIPSPTPSPSSGGTVTSKGEPSVPAPFDCRDLLAAILATRACPTPRLSAGTVPSRDCRTSGSSVCTGCETSILAASAPSVPSDGKNVNGLSLPVSGDVDSLTASQY